MGFINLEEDEPTSISRVLGERSKRIPPAWAVLVVQLTLTASNSIKVGQVLGRLGMLGCVLSLQ